MSQTKEAKKTIVLLDAHAILHRAYHALPDFASNSGEPTGALYGLATMLIKTINELEPDYLIAAYDLPEPTYRHEVYEEYKAGRPEAEEALVAQIERSRDVMEGLGIPVYEKAGFEADDILGTIVEQLKDRDDVDIIIASGDMDTLQLVSGERVHVYTLKKGIKDTIIYDEKGVKERFGFPPELLPDYKGLSGDPSDNIPGISGIGDKTATALITEFGGIEDIYKTLKENPEKLEKAGVKPRIKKLLEENEEEAQFSKMLGTIRRDAPINFALPEETWRETRDTEKALTLFSELGFRSLRERLKESFGESGEGVQNADAGEEQKQEDIPETELTETAVALWLVDSTITNPSRDDILEFAETDSFKEAKKVIFRELRERNLEKVFTDIEKPLIPVVQKMTERGICVNRDYLKDLSETYHKELEKIEKNIFKHAGEEFNINSPRQLASIIYDKLDLAEKSTKKTSTGQRSTRESELLKLKGKHPIIDEILDYRELQKLLSTYIDNVPDMVGDDGRLHAQFLQTGTTTGRMASQNPNLQNIPIRTELGRAIRNAFTATEGFTLAAFDYSQIELKVAAFLSGDEKLIDVFTRGGDVHATVAAEVFDVPPEEVDSEMRRQAKVINFGILYGMGVVALQQNLGTNRAEAQRFLNEYFKKFAGLTRFLERTKQRAAKNGYTETLFGRRRYIEGINSSVPYIRAAAERMAINAPIQGTQADIIKIAMVRIDEYLQKEGLAEDAHLLLQVHDELIYEITEDKLEDVSARIKEIMESVLSPKETEGVPITTDVSVGPNWGELEKIEIRKEE